MSGPICPDCGLLALGDAGKDRMKCPICGWEGKNPPRKIMDHKMGSSLWEDTQRYLKMREEGNLAYFRIYLGSSEDNKNNAGWEIMDLLGVDHMVTSGDVIKFFREERPSKEFIDKLKAIKGVKKVEVF